MKRRLIMLLFLHRLCLGRPLFNGIAEGDMRSAVLLSDDGSSTGTAFLTDFFFEADIRSRHPCTTFLAGFFLLFFLFFFFERHYCYVI